MGELFFVFALLFTQLTFAGDKPLDPPYRHLVHPIVDHRPLSRGTTDQAPLPPRNDVLRVLAQQGPVKDQLYRGTCSIFSSTALVEGVLMAGGLASTAPDLSEEWLQYLTTQASPEEGSTSPDNFKLLREWGLPSEAALPYGGEAWSSKKSGLALRRCGYIPRGPRLNACLVSHRDPELLRLEDEKLLDQNSVFYDPEFVNARREALANRDSYLGRARGGEILDHVNDVKSALARGLPLAMDLDFYLGAWSHSGGKKYGIQRSPKLWKNGVVTYPEKGSLDRIYSKREPAGHSVVVVGYDDEVEVEYWVNMKDGSRRKFKRRGVYYFKNSWGTTDWAADFEVGGRKYPGYGMILQDHAHEFGQFFKLEF